MKTPKNHYKHVAWFIVAAAFIAAAISFFIPVAPTVTDADEAHLRTASAVVSAVLYIGTVIWFWTGLNHFRTRLRIAYILLGIGLIMFAIAMLQLPIFGLFDLWKTAWATAGGAVLIFVLSSVPMYLAMRQLARLAGVKGLATYFWVVTLAAVVAAVIAATVSPHFIRHEMVGAPVYVGVAWATAVYIFFAGLLAYKSVQMLGSSYTQALTAQYQAFFFLALTAVNEATVVTFMPRTDTFYSVYGIYLWTFIAGGFLFVRASYYFHLLTVVYAPELEGDTKVLASDKDYIDSIVGVANLASRVDQIDPILNGLRQVTARHGSGGALTESEKRRLMVVYGQLEDYLGNGDPLRRFSREQLHDHVTPAFGCLLKRAR